MSPHAEVERNCSCRTTGLSYKLSKNCPCSWEVRAVLVGMSLVGNPEMTTPPPQPKPDREITIVIENSSR